MATLQELRGLFSDSDLMEKVEAATVITANNLLLASTPTTNQKAWAAAVFATPASEAKKALMAVLASNSGATVSQIQGASDTVIQGNVTGVAQVLVDALAGV